jgi:hypothetical protein
MLMQTISRLVELVCIFLTSWLAMLCFLRTIQGLRCLPAALCIGSYQEEGLHGLFAVRNATELLWGYEVSCVSCSYSLCVSKDSQPSHYRGP